VKTKKEKKNTIIQEEWKWHKEGRDEEIEEAYGLGFISLSLMYFD